MVRAILTVADYDRTFVCALALPDSPIPRIGDIIACGGLASRVESVVFHYKSRALDSIELLLPNVSLQGRRFEDVVESLQQDGFMPIDEDGVEFSWEALLESRVVEEVVDL